MIIRVGTPLLTTSTTTFPMNCWQLYVFIIFLNHHGRSHGNLFRLKLWLQLFEGPIFSTSNLGEIAPDYQPIAFRA